MRWNDILSAALHNLLRRRLRSALTMLGVVIGTCAIVVTLSLGYGAEEAQMRLMEESTNLKLIQVYPYYSYSGDTSSGSGRRITRLNDSVLQQIKRLDGVEAATPVVSFYPNATLKLLTGDYEAYAYLTAVEPEAFYRLVDMESGSGFSGRTDKMEFVLNEVYMMEFKDPDEDEGEYIDTWTYLMEGTPLPTPPIRWQSASFRLQMRWYDYSQIDSTTGQAAQRTQEFDARCVGSFKADANDWTFSSGPVVDLDWLKRLRRDNSELFKALGVSEDSLKNYENVYVLAESVDDVEQLAKDLTEMGLQCYSPMDYVATFKEQISTMQAFLGVIGAISMLVAALSIANTMMMSIYERTREIGVMKVLGCSLGNIRALFLCEAAYIGLFGALAGLAASYGLSWALNNVAWLQQAISAVMAGSVLFAEEGSVVSLIPPALAAGTGLGVVGVAVLSGVSPAQRAMRLSSLAAIRNAD
ncbi:MAG: ABC transporter permease [Eubacteriales bacterium]|nr:ABC transporter permease [Eubacteriales bacterium]